MISHDRSRGKGLLRTHVPQSNSETIDHLWALTLEHSGKGDKQNLSLAVSYALAGLDINPESKQGSDIRNKMAQVATHILNDESDIRISNNGHFVVMFADRSTMSLEHYRYTTARLALHTQNLDV